MQNTIKVPMQIVKIKKIKQNEIVYNLAVEHDESYILNGVISHNCRCTLAPATDAIPDKPDTGAKEFEEWINS